MLPAIRTPEEAIKSELIGLSVLKKERGQDVAVSVLVEIIGDAIEFFSVGKSMNSEQLGETVRLILQEFYFLKLSDMVLFLDRFKSGFYGKTFDRVDGNVIMVALREYCEERMNTAETLSLEKHKELKTLESEELFVVEVGDGWAHLEDDGLSFSCVTVKDWATQMPFKKAIGLKGWLVKGIYSTRPETVKIKRPGPLFDHIAYKKEHHPDLVPFKDLRDEKVKAIKKQLKAIEDNGSLSDYEKNCEARKILLLEPITEKEFLKQQKEFIMGMKKL